MEYIFIIILAIVVVAFISFKAAKVFEFIAEEKGYNGKAYFLWCFFFGIVGYAMVIALPDRADCKNIENMDSEFSDD